MRAKDFGDLLARRSLDGAKRVLDDPQHDETTKTAAALVGLCGFGIGFILWCLGDHADFYTDSRGIRRRIGGPPRYLEP